MADSSSRPVRTVRSFVRRAGRISENQQRALADLWPKFGIDFRPELLDLAACFGRSAPCVLEIGFGNGDNLLAAAQAQPDTNFIGVEVHRQGIGRVLHELEVQAIGNVRLIAHDAVEVLQQQIADESLSGIWLFFPDPWPKKRHHKRRIIQPAFIELVTNKLAPGGQFHMATDWEDYAHWSRERLDAQPRLTSTAQIGGFVPRPPTRVTTKFEQRGHRLGHGSWDLIYIKSPSHRG